MRSKDAIKKIWGESAQKAIDTVTGYLPPRKEPIPKPDPKDALDQVYQYIDEFQHLSERLMMVADNCKQKHNQDSCRAIATLITTNAKIVDEKLKRYLAVIIQNKIDETVEMITRNSTYVDPLPETMPTQLEGQITEINDPPRQRLDKEE